MTAEDSTLLYLFGLPAAGKNFVGTVLADTFGYTFYDGDLDLPKAMREAVRDGRPFTDEMRDEFYATIIDRIGELQTAAHRTRFWPGDLQGAASSTNRRSVSGRYLRPD